jgi:DNA-binding transcriptional LysR family regulator
VAAHSGPELRLLRYFLAVADELHFGRAATRLHISQPSLSYAIRALEESLGVELFTRTKRNVRLTDAGRLLLAEAPGALAGVDRALTRAGQAGRGELGELSIGFIPSAASSLVPTCVRNFGVTYPGVRLELTEMLDDALLGAVAAGELDAAFVRSNRHASSALAFEPVLSDRMCAVLSRGHRLARREELSYGDLAEERFVLCSCARPRAEAREGFDTVVEGCLTAGFSPQIAQESSLPATTLGLVAAGVGIAVLSELFRPVSPNEVVFIPLTGAPSVIYVTWQPGEPSAIRDNFITVVRTTGETVAYDSNGRSHSAHLVVA